MATTGQRILLTSILTAAMAAAIFAGPAIGVLSRFLIDDFEVSRAAIGWVVAAGALAGAVLSPIVGRITDRIGGKRALLGVFAISALGLAALGIAPQFGFLVAGAVVFGIAQAGANPSTNTLIGDLVAPGERGVITGVKQSGVQVGIFLGGLLLPAAALAIGWRAALMIAALFALVWLVVAAVALPPASAPNVTEQRQTRRELHPAIKWITAYALFMGMSGGSLTIYTALFAQESLGYHVTTAGLAVAVIGIVSVIARVVWGYVSEQSGRFDVVLRTMAILALVSVGGLWLASVEAAWLLWPAVALVGVSGGSWNAPAMMAVIALSSGRDPGRASGIVIMGFSAGLAIGPPIFGFSVDATGDYGVGLALAGAAYAVSIFIAWLWTRSPTGQVAPA